MHLRRINIGKCRFALQIYPNRLEIWTKFLTEKTLMLEDRSRYIRDSFSTADMYIIGLSRFRT